MNVRRIQAIFEKDLKDFMKNSMTLFMPILPIFLAFFYQRLGAGTGEDIPSSVVYMLLGTAFSAVTAGSMMILMAEEKEKKTLRGLMVSPASFLDIIIGKSLVTTLITVVSLGISLFILDSNAISYTEQWIGIVLLFLFFLLLGITVGLFVKTVGMTTAYLMPIMFVFGFTPMIEFLGFAPSNPVMKIADKLPISQMLQMTESDAWSNLAIVGCWTFGSLLLAFICFQRVKRDNFS